MVTDRLIGMARNFTMKHRGLECLSIPGEVEPSLAGDECPSDRI